MPSKPGSRRVERVYKPLPTLPSGSLVVGYVRYSSEMQDSDSIVTQKRDILELAAKLGWVVNVWYEEPEHSAKYEDRKQRPIFDQLLTDAEQGKIKGILCFRNNRWSRNSGITHTSIDLLRRLGVWWQTSAQDFTINNILETGPGMYHAIDTQMSESYIRELSKTSSEGKKTRALQGFQAGQASFGYWEPDYSQRPEGAPMHWKPLPMPVRRDPENWDALGLVAELRLNRYSAKRIGEALNAAGYLTRGKRRNGPKNPVTGEHSGPMRRPFNEDSVRYILINPFYREYEPGCGKGTILYGPENILCMGQHEAAFDWDTWHRMEEIAQELYNAPHSDARSRLPYPFGGLLVCSVCGEVMRSMKMRNKKGTGYLTYHTCFPALRPFAPHQVQRSMRR